MSHREDYPAGVPCWVECLVPDTSKAIDFYSTVFGWECVGSGPIAGSLLGEYFVARKDSRDVCGIAPLPEDTAPVWFTQVAVNKVEDTLIKAEAAGGKRLIEPFDASPAGRLGVVADTVGGAIGLWESMERRGAQVVNERSAWVMSTLVTSNTTEAKAFYAQTFGWTFQEFDGVELARISGYVGGEPSQPIPRDVVAVVAPTDQPASVWDVNFWVGSATDTVAQAVELGATVVMPPTRTISLGRMPPLGTSSQQFTTAVIRDTQGATFSISQLHPEQ